MTEQPYLPGLVTQASSFRCLRCPGAPPPRGNVLATDLEIGDNRERRDRRQGLVAAPLRVIRCRCSLGTQASHRSPDSEVPSINFVPVPSSELSAQCQKITCSPAITQKLKLVTIDSIKILD